MKILMLCSNKILIYTGFLSKGKNNIMMIWPKLQLFWRSWKNQLYLLLFAPGHSYFHVYFCCLSTFSFHEIKFKVETVNTQWQLSQVRRQCTSSFKSPIKYFFFTQFSCLNPPHFSFMTSEQQWFLISFQWERHGF